jgi:DDE superfamily endonuclease
MDQLGPEAAKSFAGAELVHVPSEPAARADRATQEIDYGRRGKGYIFGAFQPATGEALTQAYARRTIANWLDFLERVERWVPLTCVRIYAIVDNLSVHRAADVLLFALAHPRWEFVFQPK